MWSGSSGRIACRSPIAKSWSAGSTRQRAAGGDDQGNAAADRGGARRRSSHRDLAITVGVLLSDLVDAEFTLLATSSSKWARPVRRSWSAVNPGVNLISFEPSDLYAILCHSDRYALAKDAAVGNARLARRTAQPCPAGRADCGAMNDFGEPEMTTPALRIAVLVPCFNEEAAVATVVADFRKALPTAEIFVYDNNSKDRTVEVARGGRRHRAQRAPPGQGPCGPAHVRRYRCRRLCAGRWRRDL